MALSRSTLKNLGAGKKFLSGSLSTSNPVDAAMSESSGSAMAPSGVPAQSGSSGFEFPQLDVQSLLSQLGSGAGTGGAPGGGGSWSGPLGQVPNHPGWGGMQPGAQQWTLRLLGAFPQLGFSSGFRTPQQNAAANGAPNSGHMRGWKADFSGNSALLHQAAAWAKNYGARVLLHDAGSGFHLDVSWENVPS